MKRVAVVRQYHRQRSPSRYAGRMPGKPEKGSLRENTTSIYALDDFQWSAASEKVSRFLE